jgi:glycosyltransferase involved in cell wall biosynthesis
MMHHEKISPIVSVIIATYNRGYLLNHVLEALTNQTCDDFEVLMVVKPSGDGTEQIIETYRERLNIKIIVQNHGYVTDALNLGLKHVKGEIFVFIDDDAIPFPNLIQAHILSYSEDTVGAVAGDVMPVILDGKKICQFTGVSSEIIPAKNSGSDLIRKLRHRPLKGLENYLFYISKAGFVSFNYDVADVARDNKIVYSLLAKGANMSVSSKAIADFQFPTSCIVGLTFEQQLAWYLWKKGYRVIFNPALKVYHIHHGQSLSRNIKDVKKKRVHCAENSLLFYRLHGSEPELSIMHRIVWLLIDPFIDIIKICINKEFSRISMFKHKFFAELIGLRWLICKKLKLRYSPLVDLEKMLQ